MHFFSYSFFNWSHGHIVNWSLFLLWIDLAWHLAELTCLFVLIVTWCAWIRWKFLYGTCHLQIELVVLFKLAMFLPLASLVRTSSSVLSGKRKSSPPGLVPTLVETSQPLTTKYRSWGSAVDRLYLAANKPLLFLLGECFDADRVLHFVTCCFFSWAYHAFLHYVVPLMCVIDWCYTGFVHPFSSVGESHLV